MDQPLAVPDALPGAALERAEAAYGAVVRRDLERAQESFLASPERQERCFRGLGIDETDKVRFAVAKLTLG